MDRTAEGILLRLIQLVQLNLDDIADLDDDRFFLGQRNAYVECLEIVQDWEHARENGLDYDIEKRYRV